MQKGQAERLAPLVAETLGEAGVGMQDVDRIGVGVGPGNFTGVRISVAFARGLALSLGRPAIGVTRFAALAESAPPDISAVLSAVPTRRGQVAAQLFRRGPDGWEAEGPPEAGEAEAIAPRFPSAEAVIGAAEALAAATGLPGLEGDAPDPVQIARLAARAPDTAPRPAPFYLRPADAAPPSETAPALLP